MGTLKCRGKLLVPECVFLSAQDLMADTGALHKNGPVLMTKGKVVCIKIIRGMINVFQVMPFC